MEVGVDRLHVVQRDWFPKQLFVKRQREASVDVVAVKHRHAHDAAHKVEVRQVFLQVTNSVYLDSDCICSNNITNDDEIELKSLTVLYIQISQYVEIILTGLTAESGLICRV